MNIFTEKHTTGFGKNIGNSFMAIFFGILLLIGSSVLLWWNEGRSVEQMDALNEMNTNIVTLADTIYHPEYNNKPLWIQGEVKSVSEIHDPLFGVKSNDLSLKRTVEMYQWEEKKTTDSKRNTGGSTETATTYRYDKKWSSVAIDSTSFKQFADHNNPSMLHQSRTFNAGAQIGGYRLGKSVVAKISITEPYDNLTSLPEKVGNAKNYKSFLYIGLDAKNPTIGDLKITYKVALAGEYSIIALSKNKTLTSYTTDNNKIFTFVRNGNISAKNIFQEELSNNSTLTWILRVVGLLMMFVGFSALFGMITTVASFIPGLSFLVNGIVGIVAAILTFIVGATIISIAWFVARPILALVILSIGIGSALLLVKFGKKKKLNVTGEVSPPPRKVEVPPVRAG